MSLPEGWRETTLGEVAKANQSSIGKKYLYQNILYLDTGSVTKGTVECLQEFILDDAPSRAKRLVKRNSIVYSTVRPNQKHYGFIKNPQQNLVVSTGFTVLDTIIDKAHPEFIYYFLTQNKITIGLHQIAEQSTSTYPSIKPENILNLEINLPPLQEQKAIASMLSSFDEKIELLKAQNETLEQMAQGVFREWFVDGVDESWEVGTLKEEFTITMGQSPKGSSYNEDAEGTIFYQGRAEFQSRFPKRRLYTTEPKRYADKFDVLMSVRAPVGDINVASEKCCIGRGLAGIHSEYKSYLLYKMKFLKKQLDVFESEGTVFGSINKTSLENLEVIIPHKSIVEKYNLFALPIDKKIFNNYEQIQTLQKTRDTLLPKLMSGKLRVKGVADA